MIILAGRAALGAARQARALAKIQAAVPTATATGVSARWVHLVAVARPLTAPEQAQLAQMLAYGPADATGPVALAPVAATVWVTPRIGTTSPWSSKATDIARVCGLAAVTRIERAIAYTVTGAGLPLAQIGAALADRMTESVITREEDLARVLGGHTGEPRPLAFVALGTDGQATLRAASTRLGLALADDEIEYLVVRYRELGRDPTDVELMMFAQANSEHCRHKIFNAEWFVDGAKQDASLFQLIKRTHAASPAGTLSAYTDNAAVVEGSTAMRFFPREDGVYRGTSEPVHILGKVETHNHPTAISPFPGAATGSGGEIRDEGATGRGGKPKAGLTGFTVSDLRIPGALEPWEAPASSWVGSPARIATALDIMLDGPLGGAAFNNEFGRPAILGYFRTYEHPEAGGTVRGYHKPVMLAGGIGSVRPGHVEKAKVPAGAALIVLGGPAFLIGLGGGAASSLAQGASAEDLDFASVQRDNAEIERRCQEVIDRCWALGDRNPILSIHDVGAGGLSNAMPELVNDAGLGAQLELREIPTGEPDLSPLELWCNEAQERYVLAIDPARVSEFSALCARERAPWAQLGIATPERRLTVADRRGGPAPVDLPLEVMLGKAPRMTRRAQAVAPVGAKLDLAGATVAEALDRVLGLPTVADKSFLVTIGDRTVGGLISRDPMVGRFQVPVADCALTLAGFDTHAGEVMSIGERPPVALLDAAAASRLAISEAILNLAGAPIGALGRIKLSCNWMAAAGHPGEDARLYAGVRAASETAIALGISIPVGKDSMSMRTVWSGPPLPASRAGKAEPSAEAALATLAELGRDAPVPTARTPSSPISPMSDDDVDAQLAALERSAKKQLDLEELARMRDAPAPTGDLRAEIAAELRISGAVSAADSISDRVAGGPGSLPFVSQPYGGRDAAKPPTATRSVVSPVTLVVTAFGPVLDVTQAVTPELRGDGHQLLLVDLGAGQGRLGGSCLAQAFGQLGDVPPDLDDAKRLGATFAALQDLVARQQLTAYHDRSDGGLIVSAIEMAFAAGLALELETSAVHVDPFAALFAEELGALVEVASASVASVTAALTAAGARVVPIGRALAGTKIRVTHAGTVVIDAERAKLRARWSQVSHQLATRRDDPTCAAEEHATRLDPAAPGLTAHLTFDLDPAPIAAPGGPPPAGPRPRVAVLREQGVNGQIEMAAAFTHAGFDAVDVHMTDLIEGRVDLAEFRGAVACGGFSFGDVLGAGRGWASTFRYNLRAKDALARFLARDNTFLLGVCNGCQMLADLADQIPGAGHWPRFVRNRSEQFEARLVLLGIEDSPSIFFRGMAGSRIPVANAHGEGRAELTSDQLAAIDRAGLVSARYVDGGGAVATTYPANPNGSPAGVAALTTADGRCTIMMPHPERVFRNAQLSWRPREWTGNHSPWMRMFRNARDWVG
ncbi:MAG: phosphoribosylformylglycinamidine synthase [Myxococcales bacterium]|nr:phosphoribosylformylglycinamidine synthase [Myxococcales bacterium]